MLCVTPFFVLLCWLRDLSMLEPTSAIGTAVLLLALLTVLGEGLASPHEAAPRLASFDPSAVAPFIGVGLFTFTGHDSTVAVVLSMGERKGEYSSILLALATAGVGVILAYALACAVLYGDETQGNILLSVDGGLAAGLKACMSVAVLFSLPIKMFPASQIVEEALFTHDTAAGEGAEEEGGGAAEAARGAQQAGGGHSHACGRTAARTALALVSLLTALSLPDFKFLVALSGALNVGVIAFVLPPLMYVLLARGAMRPASVAAHGLLCALGTVVTVLCTAMVVAQKLHPAGGELPPTPPPLDTYEVEDPLESYDWRAGG